MEKSVFYQKERKYIFATAFEECFQNDAFASDVIIKVGSEKNEIHCHRLVLASSSNFLSMVLSTVSPGKIPVILLPDISGDVMNIILTYMYYGEVSIPAENYTEVVDACRMLKIKPAFDSIEESITQKINEEEIEENCEDLMEGNSIKRQQSKLRNRKSTKNKKINSIKRSEVYKHDYKSKISVTPESAIQLKEKLSMAVRRVYEDLEISISPMIQKSISGTELVVENNLLMNGLHECGLCDESTKYIIRYGVYCKTGNITFLTKNFKTHLVEKHPEK